MKNRQLENERRRERYMERKLAELCVDCAAGLQEDDGVRCRECAARIAVTQSRNPKARARRQRQYRERSGDAYAARHRDSNRASYWAKKLAGICIRCSEPALSDSVFCSPHREHERQKSRNRQRRKHGWRPRVADVAICLPPPAPVEVTASCACGSPATVGASCARCAHLDGDGKHGAVIAALRLSDGMSLLELCEALGMDTGLKNGRRQMWRWVKDLLEQGRVRRYWRESTGMDEHAVFNGSGKAKNAIGCWAYALDGKTEREWARRAA